MAHIVIMGAGIGGMPAAYELREMLPTEHRITVLNTTDFFQFVPSNPWVAVGWRQREEVTLPIAPYLTRKKIGFVAKAVTSIDPVANRLTLVGGDTLDYDYLVIATGPKLAFDEVIHAGLEKAKMIDEAQAYRVEMENSALSEKSVIQAEAENYSKRIVAEVQAESIYFDRINTEYQRNPKTVLVALYNNVLSDVLGDVKDKYIIHKSTRGNQEVRLKINPESREVKKQDNQKK